LHLRSGGPPASFVAAGDRTAYDLDGFIGRRTAAFCRGRRLLLDLGIGVGVDDLLLPRLRRRELCDLLADGGLLRGQGRSAP